MGELEEVVGRVVVVGAGIAGLAAASRLRRAGVECVVVEARDRIGGRLHTVDLAGVPVDLGGSWIHHPIGNPLTALCDSHGIARTLGDPMPKLTGYDLGERRRLGHAEVDRYARVETIGFWDAVDELSARLGPSASALDGIDGYLADRPFADGYARRLRQELLTEVEAASADAARNTALQWLTEEDGYDGDLFGDIPSDGYVAVVQVLASGLDIRLGVEVNAVALGADGVTVTTADGSTLTGTHVIVTVPLGVLKRDGVRFDPPLPAAARKAIDALGFGRYEKIAMRFESAFWRDTGLSHLVVFPSSADEPAMWVFDLDDFGAGPVLCAHLFHSITPYALDRPAAAAVAWLTRVLEEVYGGRLPDPVATAVTGWARDPFSGGSYTSCPVGSDSSMLGLLAEPIHGRLLLAGEHTDSARVGYADGAYSSGLRAAVRLIQVRSAEGNRA